MEPRSNLQTAGVDVVSQNKVPLQRSPSACDGQSSSELQGHDAQSPIHVPLLQTSPVVQAIPSSQGPVAGMWVQPASFEHLSAVQGLSSSQTPAVVPVHVPALQASPAVHGSKSSHGTPSAAGFASQSPVSGIQTSGKHVLPPVQVTIVDGSVAHPPCAHRRTPLHRSASSSAVQSASDWQAHVLVPAHTPPVHWSDAVQAFPSSHAVPSAGIRTQTPLSHDGFMHGFKVILSTQSKEAVHSKGNSPASPPSTKSSPKTTSGKNELPLVSVVTLPDGNSVDPLPCPSQALIANDAARTKYSRLSISEKFMGVPQVTQGPLFVRQTYVLTFTPVIRQPQQHTTKMSELTVCLNFVGATGGLDGMEKFRGVGMWAGFLTSLWQRWSNRVRPEFASVGFSE